MNIGQINAQEVVAGSAEQNVQTQAQSGDFLQLLAGMLAGLQNGEVQSLQSPAGENMRQTAQDNQFLQGNVTVAQLLELMRSGALTSMAADEFSDVAGNTNAMDIALQDGVLSGLNSGTVAGMDLQTILQQMLSGTTGLQQSVSDEETAAQLLGLMNNQAFMNTGTDSFSDIADGTQTRDTTLQGDMLSGLHTDVDAGIDLQTVIQQLMRQAAEGDEAAAQLFGLMSNQAFVSTETDSFSDNADGAQTRDTTLQSGTLSGSNTDTVAGMHLQTIVQQLLSDTTGLQQLAQQFGLTNTAGFSDLASNAQTRSTALQGGSPSGLNTDTAVTNTGAAQSFQSEASTMAVKSALAASKANPITVGTEIPASDTQVLRHTQGAAGQTTTSADTMALLRGNTDFLNTVRSAKQAVAQGDVTQPDSGTTAPAVAVAHMAQTSAAEISAEANTTTATQIVEQAVQGIKQTLKGGWKSGETFTVKLSPEGLGDIMVKLEKTADGLVLNMMATNARTAELMNSQLNTLQGSLSNWNAQVNPVQIQTAMSGNFSFGEQDFSAFSGQHSRQETTQHNFAGGGTEESGEGVSTEYRTGGLLRYA